MRQHALTAAIALVAGLAGAAAWDYSGFGPDRTRDYLMANPEVLPEAINELQRRETVARVEPMRGEIEAAYPGAILGNPQGTITLVEFSDYACGFCRQSLDDVNALVAANPDLKVVIREYPILSAGSADAARMALAAADQGKYQAFHDAMFAQDGPSPEAIEAAAVAAGLDLEMARSRIAAGAYERELENNVFIGQALQLRGTPAFIVGDRILDGAVGEALLAEAIAQKRDS